MNFPRTVFVVRYPGTGRINYICTKHHHLGHKINGEQFDTWMCGDRQGHYTCDGTAHDVNSEEAFQALYEEGTDNA